MNDGRPGGRLSKCVIEGEKITAVYVTCMGYFKIIDGKYNHTFREKSHGNKEGNYMTFPISENEYLNIHRIMLKIKIEHQSLAESIDHMRDHSRGVEKSDYRILDSLIFGELVNQNEREDDFVERLFREII